MSNELAKIQAEIKAPKGQFNKFGGYKYRSCEDIVEAAKPVLNKYGYSLLLNDDLVMVGNRFYVKATAAITNGDTSFTATAFAREEESKKGMDGSQITGAASSYARKYALNGLFAIDDTKDADATNTHDEIYVSNGGTQVDFLTDEQRDELLALLETSTYDETQRTGLRARIAVYSKTHQYEKAKENLLQNQVGYDGISNPSATDAKKQTRKVARA